MGGHELDESKVDVPSDMELKMITFLCTILVLLYHPTVSSPVDDNAIADLVLMNYFNIMNATGIELAYSGYITLHRLQWPFSYSI